MVCSILYVVGGVTFFFWGGGGSWETGTGQDIGSTGTHVLNLNLCRSRYNEQKESTELLKTSKISLRQ